MAVVLITDEAQKQFEALPRVIKARILHVIERLERWPDVAGAKPMRDELAGHYRIRTGDYRVLFSIEEARPARSNVVNYTVVVDRLGHRDGFYEE